MLRDAMNHRSSPVELAALVFVVHFVGAWLIGVLLVALHEIRRADVPTISAATIHELLLLVSVPTCIAVALMERRTDARLGPRVVLWSFRILVASTAIAIGFVALVR